jgi:murein L,D-transpeptidase YafK
VLLALVAGCSTPAVEQATPPARTMYVTPLPVPSKVDFVLVDKSDRTLTLYGAGLPLKTYRGLQLGGAPVGPKHFEGDERTPEGRYVIDYRNPQSAYHLSLHISYPSAADADYAAGYGRSAGGEIFIHGQPNGYGGRPEGDWTDGCIALSDAEIENLWSLVADGTPIKIQP